VSKLNKKPGQLANIFKGEYEPKLDFPVRWMGGGLNQKQRKKDLTAPTVSTLSTGENIRASFQLITRWESTVIFECRFAEMTRDHYLTNKQYCTPCLKVVLFQHFYKNKQRQLNWCLLSFCYFNVYFLSLISAFLTYIISLMEAFARLKICLFCDHHCFVGILQNVFIFLQF